MLRIAGTGATTELQFIDCDPEAHKLDRDPLLRPTDAA